MRLVHALRCLSLLAVASTIDPYFSLRTREMRHTVSAAQKYPPTIVFMTDFGVVDDSVAICRGVMYSVMPDVRIVDLTHEVTPFSILRWGAFSGWRDAVLSGGDGVCGGDRSGGGQHAQGDCGAVEARAIFCAAR